MRPLAYLLLRLYPRAWRDRYGDEMRDLLAARPVRLRTLADLCFAMLDTWTHRKLIPSGRGSFLQPVPLLAIGACTLWAFWNPATRDVSSLNRGWANALAAGVTALGWIPAIVLTVSGASGMSVWFLIPVAVSALVSLAMCVAVARFALSMPRPAGLPEPATA
ncbi:hypothetical protein [Microtetraspora malaysiensis]|uniref:hypothetical protein n=1 Tax=Microtetraspora malaysiensis TaxID=161358 RepID=UPI000836BCCE|nr:hypothetical protein [Microtetraspora malaysiensis]